MNPSIENFFQLVLCERNNEESFLESSTKDHEANIVWEWRCFWPNCADPVQLKLSSFSSLKYFQSLTLEDVYVLVDRKSLNLKVRGDKLAYKPLIEQDEGLLAYGKKKKFSFPLKWADIYSYFPRLRLTSKFCNSLAYFLVQLRQDNYDIHLVTFQKKVYRCKIKPKLQLELSQFELNHRGWFSLCLEGNSYYQVKQEIKNILKEKTGEVMGYVEFLEKYKAL